MYSSSFEGLYPFGTTGRPVVSSVSYGTTFTLPRGAGAAGFAATATATLPVGRGRDVTAADDEAGLEALASAGLADFAASFVVVLDFVFDCIAGVVFFAGDAAF